MAPASFNAAPAAEMGAVHRMFAAGVLAVRNALGGMGVEVNPVYRPTADEAATRAARYTTPVGHFPIKNLLGL